jgi:hypothetical protein
MAESRKAPIPKKKLKIAGLILIVDLIMIRSLFKETVLFWELKFGSLSIVILVIYGFIAWLSFAYISLKLKHGDIDFYQVLEIERKIEEANRLETSNIQNTQLRNQVENREIEGWNIVEIDNLNDRVIMESTKGGSVGGHAVTGFLTGLWTFGAGNVAYNQLSKKRNKERIVVTMDENDLPGQSKQSPHELLGQLDQLQQDGLITIDEYEEKKKEILDNL